MKIGVNESRAKLACVMPSADNFLSVAKKSELSVSSVESEISRSDKNFIAKGSKTVGFVRGISSRSEKNNYKLVIKLTSVGDKSNICCRK